MKFERISREKCRIEFEKSVRVDQAFDWCKAQWGQGGRDKPWRYGWGIEKHYFYFVKEEDAVFFMLRWSDK